MIANVETVVTSRLLLCGAVFVLGLIQAQPPVLSPADAMEQRVVAGLFASADPGRRAWGAYLAGNYQQTRFVPQLRRLLTAADPDVRRQALDALIRLDADVPANELLPLWPAHRAPVLILLARAPGQNRVALRSLLNEEIIGTEWVAVHNLLVSIKAPGLAMELLSHMTVRVTVLVCDAGGRCGSYGAGGGGGVSNCGGVGYRPGFPPLYHYTLTSTPARGDRLLAPGRHPIHYRRRRNPSHNGGIVDRERYRLEYLAQLLDTQPEKLPLRRSSIRSIDWPGADRYPAAIEAVREEMAAQFAALVQMLHARGLATPHETDGLRPRIDLNIIDTRAKAGGLSP